MSEAAAAQPGAQGGNTSGVASQTGATQTHGVNNGSGTNNGATSGNTGANQGNFTKRTSVAARSGDAGGNQSRSESGENGDGADKDTSSSGSDGNVGGEQGDGSHAGDNGFALPDAYKDKPWASKIKSTDDLWSQIDNLQMLVGKKAVVPDFTKATPADVEAFNAQLRPADKAEYAGALKMPENIPEAEQAFYADVLYEGVVRPDVANTVLEKFSGAIEAKKAEMVSQEDFNTRMTTRFGKQATEAEGPVARVENEVRQHLNQADQSVWDDMPNKYLDVTFGVINKILDQYGAGEGNRAPGGTQSGGTVADLNKQIDAINGELRGLQSRPHTMEQKNKLLTKVQDLNVRLARAEATNKRR